jgi:hypothetical protein
MTCLDAKIVMNSISNDVFSTLRHVSTDEYDEQIFHSQNKSLSKQKLVDRTNKQEVVVGRRRYVTIGPEGKQCQHGMRWISDGTIDLESVYVEQESKATANRISIEIGTTRQRYANNSYSSATPVKDDAVLCTSHGHPINAHSSKQWSHMICDHVSHAAYLSKSAYDHSLSSRVAVQTNPLINPFSPASIRVAIVPGRRRWAHTFPIGRDRLPWHFHHLRQTEDQSKSRKNVNLAQWSLFVLPSTSKHILKEIVSKQSSALVTETPEPIRRIES